MEYQKYQKLCYLKKVECLIILGDLKIRGEQFYEAYDESIVDS